MFLATKRTAGGGWAAALLALLVGASAPLAQGFREDEFECEETIAYLKKCCEAFDAHAISCDYDSSCGYTTYAALSPGESRCIRAKSCNEIRSEQICQRLAARGSRSCDDGYGDDAGEQCSGGDGVVCQ
jgi:hypothetical protein